MRCPDLYKRLGSARARGGGTMVLSSTLGTMWDERISLAYNFTGTVDGQSAPQNAIRNPTHAGPARPQPEHHVTVTSQNSESCRISNHHLCSTIDCRQETLGYRNDTGKAAVTSLQLVGLLERINQKIARQLIIPSETN